MLLKKRTLSNQLWQPFVFCILIIAAACQQGKPQAEQKVANQLPSPETKPLQPDTKQNSTMTFYLTRFSYTQETRARMIKDPEDRRAAATQYIEAIGGKLHGFWYALGEYDGYCLWEAPNNVSIATVGFAISAGGALSKFETTVLLTVDETLEALQHAQTISYRQPGVK